MQKCPEYIMQRCQHESKTGALKDLSDIISFFEVCEILISVILPLAAHDESNQCYNNNSSLIPLLAGRPEAGSK
jgi:hypothetical protein